MHMNGTKQSRMGSGGRGAVQMNREETKVWPFHRMLGEL